MQVLLCSCCLDWACKRIWGFIVLLPVTFASFPWPCCPETGAATNMSLVSGIFLIIILIYIFLVLGVTLLTTNRRPMVLVWSEADT